MKIYKITEASEYLGVSINTLKTLANNGKINSFKPVIPLVFMEGVAVERRKNTAENEPIESNGI